MRNVTVVVGRGAMVSVTKPYFPFIKGQKQRYDPGGRGASKWRFYIRNVPNALHFEVSGGVTAQRSKKVTYLEEG